MPRSESISRKPPIVAADPFPWKCAHCGKNEVAEAAIDYKAEVRHDGRVHEFTVHGLRIPVCQACGERVFTGEVDRQINFALHEHLSLLTPDQIRQALDSLKKTQKEVSQELGIAEATLSRWLTETQIQSKAMDNLLRVYFEFPEVRSALGGRLQTV
jgi:putative zinc finger/helix-turn-helix YgiT family protein